eukprot:gene9340-11454_t
MKTHKDLGGAFKNFCKSSSIDDCKKDCTKFSTDKSNNQNQNVKSNNQNNNQNNQNNRDFGQRFNDKKNQILQQYLIKSSSSSSEKPGTTLKCPNDIVLKFTDDESQYDIELIYDRDIERPNWPTQSPKGHIPRVLYSDLSYSSTFCEQFDECARLFNWSISATIGSDIQLQYYTRDKIREFINNVEYFDLDDILRPKLHFVDTFNKKLKEKQQQKLDDKSTQQNNNNNNENNQNSYKLKYPIPKSSWMTSNCKDGSDRYSNRVEYIRELSTYINIDSYGRCLNNVVIQIDMDKDKGIHDVEYKKRVISKYKFYFAFEYANCKGYLTEKAFQCFESGTIPVIMTHPSNLYYLPRGSYIYVGDFKSAKELADYLVYLDENENEYKKYFAWRTNKPLLEHWESQFSNQDNILCSLGDTYKKWINGNYYYSKKLLPQSNNCVEPNYFEY